MQANGKDLIWGQPPKAIEATYLSKGKQRTSLLLASGWWGISRHFHYIP
jgi:7-dehydrocholesterol reductase